jgi:hypothetical protein
MQKPLSVLLAAMTVTAIIMSAHAGYAQVAREIQAQRNDSVEVLKVHATVHASMEAALDRPDMPEFFLAPIRSRG